MWRVLLKSISVLSLLFFIGIGEVYAQHSIEGVVFEEKKGNPLVGATIIMLNDNNRVIGGTTTNIDGKFKVLVPSGIAKITFSFIGLKSVTLPFEVGKKYEIILKADLQLLDEVVISGKREPRADFGMITKAKKDMSNAVSSVDMKILETQSVSTVDQLLQGAAPGLQVTFNSGDPGAGASLQIRGVTSLEGNNSPLWVIDGAEVLGDDYNVSDLNNFGSSPIAGLDPSDIESIDVLKDASSTAIYGSRGANGVIVIRTKRGKKGKPRFSASATFVSVLKPRRIPLLSGDQQRMFILEYTDGMSVPKNEFSKLDNLRGDLSQPDAWMYNNNTDMVDLITRVGFQQKYSLSLQGGGERLNYYWSLGYDTQYGTTIGGGFNRFSTMLNLDYRISDKLKVSAKFSYDNQLTDKRCWGWPIKGAGYLADVNLNPRAQAHQWAAFYPAYNKNGDDFFIGGLGNLWPYPIKTRSYNPLAMIDKSVYDRRENHFFSQFVLDFDITRKLNFNTQVSVDYREGGNEFFAPSSATGALEHYNSLFNAGWRENSYNMLLINKNRLFWHPLSSEIHYIGITAIADVIYSMGGNTEIRYDGSGLSDMTESAASSRIVNAAGTNNESSSVSLVLDLHYRLMNRYNFSLSMKTEGSSQYGKDNPFEIYPTLGFAWRMEEESFLSEKEWVTALKPRFSYGQTGKLPPITNMLSVTYGNASDGYMGDPYSYIKTFAYDNIHAERTTEYNYGLDWELFKGRFSGEFNYYTRKTTDLILPVPMSSTTGYVNDNGVSQRYTNFGELKNFGFELGLTVVPVELKSGFRWSIYVSASRNRQKLLTMPEDLKVDGKGVEETPAYGFKTKLQEGSVIGALYGYRALGVYAKDEDAVVHDFNGNVVYDANGIPKKMFYAYSGGEEFQGGDMIYDDVNHDGIINEYDMVQIGNANVGMFGMIRNNFNYKQWSLGVSFYYSLHQDVVNGVRYDMENMSGRYNQATSILRRWRKQGDVTDMPRAAYECTRNYLPSSRWVEDASFIKLKEVSLTYNFPKRLISKLRLSQLSAWVTGMDLWCGTKYKGVNPEIGLNKGNLTKIAVDEANTAPSPQISFGLRASF